MEPDDDVTCPVPQRVIDQDVDDLTDEPRCRLYCRMDTGQLKRSVSPSTTRPPIVAVGGRDRNDVDVDALRFRAASGEGQEFIQGLGLSVDLGQRLAGRQLYFCVWVSGE